MSLIRFENGFKLLNFTVILIEQYISHLFFFVPGLSPDVPSSGVTGIFTSSMLPCLLRCPLSTPPVSYLSYTHLSILGLAALFFFSLVCPHPAFFSLCAPLSSSSREPFSVIFLDTCSTLVVPLMCSFCFYLVE